MSIDNLVENQSTEITKAERQENPGSRFWNTIRQALRGSEQHYTSGSQGNANILLFLSNTLFGSIPVAGYTIGTSIIIFTLLPAWGFGNAAATLVGQTLVAKKP